MTKLSLVADRNTHSFSVPVRLSVSKVNYMYFSKKETRRSDFVSRPFGALRQAKKNAAIGVKDGNTLGPGELVK